MSIENRCGEIKATLQKLTDVKVSPTARLVAVLASCGITDTAEVASLVGRSVRMIQIARNELRETHCADAKPIAPNETHFAKPIAQSETHCAPRVHARAQMESLSGIVTQEEVKNPPFIPQADCFGRPAEMEKDVHFDGSNLILTKAERADWLEKFGDDQRLDLALVQAVAFVQPNSRRPLLVQVRAQLARAAVDKIDRDQRYAKAASAKPTASAAKPKSWVDDRNERARALMTSRKQPEAVS